MPPIGPTPRPRHKSPVSAAVACIVGEPCRLPFWPTFRPSHPAQFMASGLLFPKHSDNTPLQPLSRLDSLPALHGSCFPGGAAKPHGTSAFFNALLVISFVFLPIAFHAFYLRSQPQRGSSDRRASGAHGKVAKHSALVPDVNTLARATGRAPHCLHVLAADTPNGEWVPFNARTLCLHPGPLCISPQSGGAAAELLLSHGGAAPTCRVVDATLSNPVAHPLRNCTHLLQSTLCVHGHNPDEGRNQLHVCPSLGNMTSSTPPRNAAWVEGVAVVVPAYSFMFNIFHFAQVAVWAVQAAAAVPALFPAEMPVPKTLTLVFRSVAPRTLGEWQGAFTAALVEHRLAALGLRVHVHIMRRASKSGVAAELEESPMCVREGAVLLGSRWHTNTWPFANGHSRDEWPFRKVAGATSFAGMGRNATVGLEALLVRRAAYAASNVTTLLSLALLASRPGVADALAQPQRLLLDLPPRRLCYARRRPTSRTSRRFSPRDEWWFVALLRTEAARFNMTFTALDTPPGTPFDTQVRQFRGCGMVAGIHGANLLNAIFSPPFAMLLEVSNHELQAYVRGANSGLAFASYKPTRVATQAESACHIMDERIALLCRDRDNFRRVLIEEGDMEELARAVRQGVQYVHALWKSFAHLDAVPVKYVREVAAYGIDWSRAES